MPRFDDTERLRRQLAQDAARLIAEQGLQDYRQAKLKAAARLNARGRAVLPTNTEIEAALVEHQALFGAAAHTDYICSLRRCALRAMDLLESFHPRLVGPVLNGTAGTSSPIDLHVFSDWPEDVLWCVEAGGFSVASYERRLKKSRREDVEAYPGYRFVLDGSTVEATVFAYDGLRQAPVSPIDGKPMQRASRSQVAELATLSDCDR